MVEEAVEPSDVNLKFGLPVFEVLRAIG